MTVKITNRSGTRHGVFERGAQRPTVIPPRQTVEFNDPDLDRPSTRAKLVANILVTDAKADVSEGIETGAWVQWTRDGADQFRTPRRVKRVSADGKWATVEGLKTGIRTSELNVANSPTALSRMTKAELLDRAKAVGVEISDKATNDEIRDAIKNAPAE